LREVFLGVHVRRDIQGMRMESATEKIRLEINGVEVEAEPGQTILEVVEDYKLDEIPTLCHAKELEPYASCFLCTVEIEGRPNLQPSCSTRVAPGMKVTTRSERINASRRTCLELLVSNHYADCLSPCMLGCPAGVNAQGYLALAAMGEFRKAVDLVRETNPLPAICGRVCVRKCEVACRRVDIDEPVGINFIKRFVTDQPGAYDGEPEREEPKGKTVGIVGSGPAGLTAAWFLGRKGYDSVIYEALPKPGGMLRYGIPEYRLPKEVLDREIEFICRVGAKIECGVRVGKDVTLEELRKRHDAVFIAAGAMGAKEMGIPGENETIGVVGGVDFLLENTEKPAELSGTVVVVGGGNTAMDAARVSWRLGADKVIILYRRTKAEMPADKLEIEDCLKEGIEIMELAAPVEIVSEGGRLKALKCIRMKLGEPDSSGRRRPVPQEGSEFELPCDLAISAIGQEPVIGEIARGNGDGIKLTKWGTIVSNPRTMETNVPGVYAGGDVADDGPTVVIDAIRDGQRAAKAIHAYLSGEKPPVEPFVVTKAFWEKPGKTELGEIPESRRRHMHEIEVADRERSFEEVATGYEWEDTAHECARCLACGCVVFDSCKLRLYSQEYGVDMERFRGQVRKHKVDSRHPYIDYDPNKCILCARCIRTCEKILPISALGLVGRGFRTEMRPAMNDPLVLTNCVSCGNCIDTCPVGALTTKFPFPGRASLATEDVASHCGFCSLACPVTVRKFGGGAYFIEPSGRPGDYLCQYGRFGNELFIKQARITSPKIRRDGGSIEAGLPAAISAAVEGLKGVAEKYGPQSVAVFVSPEQTNEVMYLAARIAREGLGTNNVSSFAALAGGVDSGALDRSLGFTASTSDGSAVEKADVIVCNNTNLEGDHLILSEKVIAAVRRGAKLVVANSSRDPLEVMAEVALDPMRGRAALLWNGVIQVLLDDGFFDRKTVKAVPGGDEFLADLHDYSPESISLATGVDAGKIKRAAFALKSARNVAIIHSPDRAEDQAPGDMSALANLAILLRGAGVAADLILPHLSANGAAVELTGADPAFHPGKKRANGLAGARTRAELLQLLESGSIRGALIVGEDPMREDKTASWLRNIEFTVALDWAATETTEFASVALPGSTYLECAGTRISYEGRLVHFDDAVKAPAGMQNWEILALLANGLGMCLNYGAVSDATGELRAAVFANSAPYSHFYWNTNGKREWDGAGRLVVADVQVKPAPIAPALTAAARYKREIHNVGLERFRIRS